MSSLDNSKQYNFMKLALGLAHKNKGYTAENPSVGCVIVKEGKILSTGQTQKNGRPHAEQNAIKSSKDNLSNSTIYITLEPCSHVGKTEPCVDLIIKHKISRVFIAIKDPDKRVNGKAIEKLKDNGIEVNLGLCEKEADEINKGFFKVKNQNTPLVSLKLATNKKGEIANKNFQSKWITNEQSRKFGHYLRSRNNAILVGANTVRQDNPTLDCRISGLEDRSPIRIVLSNSLNLNLESNIFQNQDLIKTFIATNNRDKSKQDQFIKSGINIIEFKNLKELLKKLGRIGINDIIIEGGSEIATNFLKENLVDEIYHFIGDKDLGCNAIKAIQHVDINKIDQELNFQKSETRRFGSDLLIKYMLRSEDSLE